MKRSLLNRALFRLFWNTYDALGPWLIISLAAVICSLPLVTIPAVWGALLYCAARANSEHPISLEDFTKGIRHCGWRSTLMSALSAFLVMLMLINIVFYLHPPFLLSHAVRFAFVALLGWPSLFAWLAIQVGWAFLVLQDLSFGKALRRGFLVVFAHPLVCVAVLLWSVLLFFLLLITGVGLLLVGGAVLANLWLGFAAGAVELYEEREDRQLREQFEREGHHTWTERHELEAREGARERRYQRSWREIWRPWEMR